MRGLWLGGRLREAAAVATPTCTLGDAARRTAEAGAGEGRASPALRRRVVRGGLGLLLHLPGASAGDALPRRRPRPPRRGWALQRHPAGRSTRPRGAATGRRGAAAPP